MKYEKPTIRSKTEILDALNRTDTSPRDRINTVLSAIYYGTIEFSGDVLIAEFSTATYDEKINLLNLLTTFYQMRETTYRIDESILLLKRYKTEDPSESVEIESTIDALIEFKMIFGSV